jgi:hypothetical protein
MADMGALGNILRAKRAADKANAVYVKAIADNLPPGTKVYCGRYGSGRVATVLEVSGTKVKIRSTHSAQKEYWIDAAFVETVYVSEVQREGTENADR